MTNVATLSVPRVKKGAMSVHSQKSRKSKNGYLDIGLDIDSRSESEGDSDDSDLFSNQSSDEE